MDLNLLVRRCEFAEPKQYNGKGEVKFAIVGCILWFIAIIIYRSFGAQVWLPIERIIEALSFVVFAAIPIFFLATPPGTNFAQRFLLKNNGFWFQTLTCLLFLIYICIGKILGLSPNRFVWLNQLNTLIVNGNFWFNTALFLIGAFVVLRIPFLFLNLRNRNASSKHYQKDAFWQTRLDNRQTIELIVLLVINFVYTSLVNTSLVSVQLQSDNSGYFIGLSYFIIYFLLSRPIARKRPLDRLTLSDFWLFMACVGSLFWFSRPFFRFGVFVGLDLFILVVIFGIGLGREHFGYSFQIRRHDIRYALKSILAAVLILIPAAIASGFSTANLDRLSSTGATGISYIALLFSYVILFAFRVGIFEEILFRSGLMVLIRDQLQSRTSNKLSRQHVVFISAILCSVVFGICHIGNDPSAASSLSPWIYKTTYAVLATVASLFYSFALGETNRLWCSIVIHGTVDTIAVLLLGASLTVPF